MEFQKLIGQIGIFMICAQAIMYFRPKASYEKYLRLLLGVIILIQIFQPFGSFFFGDSKMALEKSVQQFQQQMENSMTEAAKRAVSSGELLQKMSLEQVQLRMAEQLETESGQTESGQIEIEIEPVDEIKIELSGAEAREEVLP